MSNFLGGGGGLYYRGTMAVQPPNWRFENRAPTIYDFNNVSVGDLWLDESALPDPVAYLLVSLARPLSNPGPGMVADWLPITSGGGGGGGGGNVIPPATIPGNTPTVLVSVPIPLGKAIVFWGSVVGRNAADSEGIMGSFNAGARNPIGTAILVGVPQISYSQDSGASPDFNVIVNGTMIELQVTGVVADSYVWSGIYYTSIV